VRNILLENFYPSYYIIMIVVVTVLLYLFSIFNLFSLCQLCRKLSANNLIADLKINDKCCFNINVLFLGKSLCLSMVLIFSQIIKVRRVFTEKFGFLMKKIIFLCCPLAPRLIDRSVIIGLWHTHHWYRGTLTI